MVKVKNPFVAALVNIAKSQDIASFKKIFDYFSPRLKSFLMRSGADEAVAEEIIQETMTIIWTKADYYDPKVASPSTWIYTIARNCRTDMFRRLQKFDTPLAADDLSIELEEEEPFAVLHSRRGADRVRELMSQLPPDQAQILAKVYMEGKSHSEAAAELDLPLGTVKSRVRLAIQKLQVQMERL